MAKQQQVQKSSAKKKEEESDSPDKLMADLKKAKGSKLWLISSPRKPGLSPCGDGWPG